MRKLRHTEMKGWRDPVTQQVRSRAYSSGPQAAGTLHSESADPKIRGPCRSAREAFRPHVDTVVNGTCSLFEKALLRSHRILINFE